MSVLGGEVVGVINKFKGVLNDFNELNVFTRIEKKI